MNQYRILKLIGLAVLAMIIIVIVWFFEGTIYSIFINPGKSKIVYNEHSALSLPWVAAITGFIIFFLIVRYWANKKINSLGLLAVLLPMVYTFIDFAVLSIVYPSLVKASIVTFLLANGAKFLGSISAYYIYKE